MDSIENTFALMPGPCGPEFIRCDQFERAVRPVPANYIHPDFENVDAAAPAMGNHLIDLTSPEFHGEIFDRTWIYGSYDGRITFYEEMVSLAYLSSRPDACFDIKTPAAVEVAGYYPTLSCVRSDAARNEVTVSIEGFVYREAAPPAATSPWQGHPRRLQRAGLPTELSIRSRDGERSGAKAPGRDLSFDSLFRLPSAPTPHILISSPPSKPASHEAPAG